MNKSRRYAVKMKKLIRKHQIGTFLAQLQELDDEITATLAQHEREDEERRLKLAKEMLELADEFEADILRRENSWWQRLGRDFKAWWLAVWN